MRKLVLVFLVLVVSLIGNIYIHEYGHYIAAKELNLNPKIHFFETKPAGSVAPYGSSFYVSYDANAENSLADVIVALCGPLANLVFLFFVIGIYLCIPSKRRTTFVKLLFVALALPAMASVILNLIPVGYSDGEIILAHLLQ